MDKKMIEFYFEIEHETEKAYLVSDGENKIWLPKSQVEVIKELKEGAEFEIPEWLAKDKGLV